MIREEYSVIADRYKALKQLNETFFYCLSTKKVNGESYIKADAALCISLLLELMGVPNYMKGYDLISDALQLIVSGNRNMDLLTKDIYPALARKHSISIESVEINIRRTIEACWDSNNLYIDLIFMNYMRKYKKRPSNKEFIWTLSHNILLNKYFFHNIICAAITKSLQDSKW